MKNQIAVAFIKKILLHTTIVSLSSNASIVEAGSEKNLSQTTVDAFLRELSTTPLTLKPNTSPRTFQKKLNQLWFNPVNQALLVNPQEKITIGGEDFPALMYGILLGNCSLRPPFHSICPPVYRDLNGLERYDTRAEQYVAWWLNEKQGECSLLDILHTVTSDDQATAAHAVLYRGLLKIIKLIPEHTLILPTENGCLLFDIAQLKNSDAAIQFGQSTTTMQSDWANLSKTCNRYLHGLRKTLKNRCCLASSANPAYHEHLKSATQNYYEKNQNIACIMNLAKDIRKEMGSLQNKPTEFKRAAAQYQAISQALTANIAIMSHEDREHTLEGACQATDVNSVSQFLKAYIEYTQTTATATEKYNQMKDLELMFKKKTHKQRTTLFHVLRNAYGSRERACPLAKTEDTVRTLLMLIAAGASLSEVDSLKVGVTEFPGNSILSLLGRTVRPNTAALIYNAHGHPITDEPEKQRLINANILLQHVLGTNLSSKIGQAKSTRILAQKQQKNIKRQLYYGSTACQHTIAPFDPKHIEKYLEQLTTVLKNIKGKTLEQLVAFPSSSQKYLTGQSFKPLGLNSQNYDSRIKEIASQLSS